MKRIDKSILLSAITAIAFLPTIAAANNTTGSALNPLQNVQKERSTKLQLGRKLDQRAASRCVKWSTRCYKKRYCQPYYKNTCYVCRQYKGYGAYRYRKTCNFNSMQHYRTKGYWCYQSKQYSGRCDYYYKKYCKRYCYKRVYY